ncbi:MAG: hypothetical protein JXQ72_04880 [Anaerolineae bacterium]|nr:hypothetical protein [Anaerolineae bacterium]
MAKTPPAPELLQAYKLIQAGQRQEAGQLLKTYLGEHKDDVQGWWLMAHVVTKPDHVRRCLETVLKLDPAHEKARARLANLKPPASPPAAPPANKPASESMSIDAPDDSLFFSGMAPKTASSTPAQKTGSAPAPSLVIKPVKPAPPPPAPAKQAGSESAPDTAPSFEDFAASQPTNADPFAGPPVDNPFADIPADSEDVFAAERPRVLDPFDTAFLPRPAVTPSKLPQPTGKPATFNDFDAEDRKSSLEAAIGYGLIALALVVLVGLGAYVMVNGFGSKNDSVPSLTGLDGGSFTIQYPKSWDTECVRETMGYMVCGIANHAYYNEAQWYATQDVNIGEMLSAAFSMAFSGEELPDEQVSIIVMDVPTSSPAYDNGSWAKTSYEMVGDLKRWGFVSDEADYHYDKQELVLDGYTAYYYEYVMNDPERWREHESAYDVYIPHDGIMLWMRVSIQSPNGDRDYHNTIQEMIQSIDIKPVEEW